MSPRQDRHRTLWWAALAASALPLVLGLLLNVLSRGTTVGMGFGFAGAAECRGWRLRMELGPLQWLTGMPFLVVGPAFMVWARTRSRVPGWTAVTILLVAGLMKPLSAAYDLAVWGEGCAALWEPLVPRTLGWDLLALVPAGLIYLTVRRRRGRWAMAFALAVMLLLTVGGDHGRQEIAAIGPEDCRPGRVRLPQAQGTAGIEAIARMPVRERERLSVHGARPRLPRLLPGEATARGRRRRRASLAGTTRVHAHGLTGPPHPGRPGRMAASGRTRRF
ncbi:hypothetical protein Acsp04_58280 [Actinomadura sp. NBRC 104425]|uniref:hypothetical protein n=1 Tax=Actinomadura sp. NBRC 104425 TaxID=3032204 RepID=UPI0024A38721|nr:hypothetical protein [Actinomadura sp. NBRC 104425]GLZ15593.1 hypothetical protein Acsp04_58280 [Actinomadura sp. NBRC 104425]